MPLKITLKPNEVLTYAKLDEGFDDGTINTMFESAKIEAEGFLNTDFSTVDANGNRVEVEAPYDVREWVLNRVSQKYENIGSWVNPDFTQLQRHRVYPFRG